MVLSSVRQKAPKKKKKKKKNTNAVRGVSMRKLIWIAILTLCATSALQSQVRIKDETKYFPRGFEGADPVVLVDNLTRILTDEKVIGKSNELIHRVIKENTIYGDLTINDRFFLRPKVS